MRGRTEILRSLRSLPGLRGPSGGFTLLEIVTVLVITGFLGLVVNGVLARLSQTYVTTATVAERLPQVVAALNLIEAELRRDASISSGSPMNNLKNKFITDGSGPLKMRLSSAGEDGASEVALLPRDWVRKISTNAQGTFIPAALVNGAGTGLDGYSGAFRSVCWYDVELEVTLDPAQNVTRRFKLSVEAR